MDVFSMVACPITPCEWLREEILALTACQSASRQRRDASRPGYTAPDTDSGVDTTTPGASWRPVRGSMRMFDARNDRAS